MFFCTFCCKMNEFDRLSTALSRFNITRFMLQNRSSTCRCFYSTHAAAAHTPCFIGSKRLPSTKLYHRISPIRDHNVSIVPILDQWIEEGRALRKDDLIACIHELTYSKRFTHALEISFWMTDKRYFHLTPSDIAMRVDLISKAQGLEQAHNYFNNIPRQLQGLQVYFALLNCYAHVQNVEKAEAILQTMRKMGLAKASLAYNVMLKLYSRTGNIKRLETLVKEMDKNGVQYDKFTYSILLSEYASVSDIERMEKTMAKMEADPRVDLDWDTYTVVASGYRKAELLDNAFEMLRKSETLIYGTKKHTQSAYDFLLTQYAAIGKKDVVLRLWELYKEKKTASNGGDMNITGKRETAHDILLTSTKEEVLLLWALDKKKKNVSNVGYMNVIATLLKLDDLESAENVFEDWESQNLDFDIRIPNFLIGEYSRKGLLEKAESLVDRIISNAGEPDTHTWHYLAMGYLQDNQTAKGVEMINKSIQALKSNLRWKPSPESLIACVEYLKGEGWEKAEEFINLLLDKKIISLVIRDKLINHARKDEDSYPLHVWLGDILDEDYADESSDSDNILVP